jgi:two-component system sensor histidine kinase TctE
LKTGFRHRTSLRRALLLLLLPAMLAVAAADVWLTWRTAVGAANAAYDRSLFGAVKAIDANISTASGGIGVEMPYQMLEFFELRASGEVYFRVATEDGLVDIGNTDLPLPSTPLTSGRPDFADQTYYGDHVRVASYARTLDRPVGGARGEQRIIIQVAEAVKSRSDFTRTLVLESVSRDVVLIGLGAVLLAWLVNWVLAPLHRLQSQVLARRPDDLTPIDTATVPRDVTPLVEAINQHVQRNRELVEQRQRFVDDASHQLRTPLATLAAQMSYAQRERDPARVRDALRAIKVQLDSTVHQTNQMLALARADSARIEIAPIDLGALAEAVTREQWNDARERGIDLGFEPPELPVIVAGHVGLLREALLNLLLNALKYTPRGGHVTVNVRISDDSAMLSVIDDGPGIPAAERARAGERFFRASNVTGSGAGLGLAIVRSVANHLGGSMAVEAGPQERGCAMSILLPLASSAR